MRLKTDGTLDTNFGNGGKLLMPVGSSTDEGRSVIQQADGKLVVAGKSYNGSIYDFSLVRLNADGTLDTGFGNGGKLLMPVGTAPTPATASSSRPMASWWWRVTAPTAATATISAWCA